MSEVVLKTKTKQTDKQNHETKQNRTTTTTKKTLVVRAYRGGRDKQAEKRHFRAEKLRCDAVIADSCHSAFVQTHKTPRVN